MKAIFALLACLFSFYVSAAHFENLIDLTIKIEDTSYHLRVKTAKFNDQEIKLDNPDMFKPRKMMHYKLPPGRYMIAWSTEKGEGIRGNASPITEHERILVLESGDVSVKINIKGDSITLF